MSSESFLISNLVLSTRYSALSSNDLIRPRQHVGRYRQADLFGGFQIDDELELRRLLHGKIGGLVVPLSFGFFTLPFSPSQL